MPLYKQWKPSTSAEIAVWKVDEPESFFVNESGFSSTRKNEMRRIEHVAGRFLLKHLDEGFPIFKIETSHLGKPYLPKSENRHFSISHSFPYIAAAISTQKNIGVDVQVYRDKISNIQHKFLSAEEQLICDNHIKDITSFWCAKEAVFKWFGNGEVDFIKQMPIILFDKKAQPNQLKMNFLRDDTPQALTISEWQDVDFAMAWLEH